jgi:hypothetical protein
MYRHGHISRGTKGKGAQMMGFDAQPQLFSIEGLLLPSFVNQ